VLAPGGRMVVLAYQSLEDRMVKRELVARAASRSPVDLPVELPGYGPELRLLVRGAEPAGAEEIGFGDTTGMANPAQVRRFFPAARAALGDAVELTAHFHNTRGQGLANVYAAYEAGVRSFESSFGELGGCPVPRGATGNVATEDVVSMLHEMGEETGVDLEALLDATRAAQAVLGRTLGSHLLTAGPVDWVSGR